MPGGTAGTMENLRKVCRRASETKEVGQSVCSAARQLSYTVDVILTASVARSATSPNLLTHLTQPGFFLSALAGRDGL